MSLLGGITALFANTNPSIQASKIMHDTGAGELVIGTVLLELTIPRKGIWQLEAVGSYNGNGVGTAVVSFRQNGTEFWCPTNSFLQVPPLPIQISANAGDVVSLVALADEPYGASAFDVVALQVS